jgi:hypothetical protein
MYNAKLVERRTPTKEPSSGYPDINDQKTLDHNIDVCVPLLKAVSNTTTTLTGNKGSFSAFTGFVPHTTMVDVLRELKWASPETFAADFAWIASLRPDVVDEWKVILPQQKAGRRVNIRGIGDFSIHGRKVERVVRIRGNSESKHRAAIEELARETENTGYVLLYPIMDKERVNANEVIASDGRPDGVVMVFTLRLPKAAIPENGRPLIYKVAVPDEPHYALVDDSKKHIHQA